MTGDFNAGGVLPGPSSLTVTSRGVCPLDGYPLVELDGTQDHVIPVRSYAAAMALIAAAHDAEAR